MNAEMEQNAEATSTAHNLPASCQTRHHPLKPRLVCRLACRIDLAGEKARQTGEESREPLGRARAKSGKEMERNTDAAVEGVLEALTSRGWRFRDLDGEIRALIRSYDASSSSSSSLSAVEMIESELLNMDLRSFGGKSILDASSLKKSSHLRGPVVLQVSRKIPVCFCCRALAIFSLQIWSLSCYFLGSFPLICM